MSSHMATSTRHRVSREEKKVLAGTLIGTTIEWYDFFIYAQAAGLILATQYFTPEGEDKTIAQIVSWASLGISFIFRPLGAIVAGHIGDKFGRRITLVLTLILMGIATVGIGFVPTYAQIGIAAPIIIVVLRILQGFSAGGEWGGAALMSVEHAPRNKRGFFGAFPQIGVPLGMILATLVNLLLNALLTEEQFLSFGWRIPFWSSIILILVGFYIRHSVEESPVFKEMQNLKKRESAPLKQLFKSNTKEVVLAALIFIANNAAGYLVIAFFISYGVKALGMSRGDAMTASLIGGLGWLIFTMVGGWMSDKIGRVRTFQLGYGFVILWAVPMWFLVDSGSAALFTLAIFVLTIGLGPSYGPQSAMYAEMFPASVRFSGISIGYAIGAILGGAFAPMIAEMILKQTGQSWMIGLYIAALAVVSVIAVSMVPKSNQEIDLHPEEEDFSERTRK
ncbi:MAG: MFS transporter [Rothia sp. (in: high G+C Gram-positive bacteria)]|uniref:MFS transporter n=1 Tax=Rothia sp. (in: high G+C Gram-positive bacteria) TaxID=1885016 RepID=UPI0026F85B16|nr:MFS transporter [Rothia sp. (in: high G+C Gram-positive bacteria)]